MASATLSVPSISCGHCKMSIEGAVGALDGVQAAAVSIDDKTVTVNYDDAQVDLAAVKAAIEEQGYEVAPA